MIPNYHIFKVNNDVYIFGLEEWSDLIPHEENNILIKPLYISKSNGNLSNKRIIEGISFFDLKPYSERQQLDIIKTLIPEIKENRIINAIELPQKNIIHSWASCKLTNFKGFDKIFNNLNKIPNFLKYNDFCINDFYIIGSCLYGCTFNNDLDLAIIMNPSQTEKFRIFISSLRNSHTSFHPSNSYFSYQLRILSSNLNIDFQPCTDKYDNFNLLNNTVELKSEILTANSRIIGFDQSCYSLPLLYIDEFPNKLIIGSNAFRGTFFINDILTYQYQVLEVQSNLTTFQYRFIKNPWININNLNSFLDHRQRDNLLEGLFPNFK
jgi:hypothetical protein